MKNYCDKKFHNFLSLEVKLLASVCLCFFYIIIVLQQHTVRNGSYFRNFHLGLEIITMFTMKLGRSKKTFMVKIVTKGVLQVLAHICLPKSLYTNLRFCLETHNQINLFKITYDIILKYVLNTPVASTVISVCFNIFP